MARTVKKIRAGAGPEGRYLDVHPQYRPEDSIFKVCPQGEGILLS